MADSGHGPDNAEKPRKVIVGLTGNIGTGKSTVLGYLAGKGALVLDADKLAHRAIEPGMPGYGAVVAVFGTGILLADGTIDRAALGRLVFGNPARLAELEAIVHPAVFTLAREAIAAGGAPVAVVEAIKLLEAGNLRRLCQEIWVVTSRPDVQMRRLMESRDMSVEEARLRLAAQSPQEEKVRQATRVIANDGTVEELYAALDVVWAETLVQYGIQDFVRG
jgi:dephospho-CoA kinase